jgi:hypothetical protein
LCARSGGAVDRESPVERADAVGEPFESPARLGLRAAGSVVGDLDEQSSIVRGDGDRGGSRVCVFGDVRQCFGGDEVRGALHGRRIALIGDPGADGERSPVDESADGRAQPLIGEDRGVDPARELAQLPQRGLQLGLGLGK